MSARGRLVVASLVATAAWLTVVRVLAPAAGTAVAGPLRSTAVFGAVFVLMLAVATRPGFARRCVAPATPAALAGIRILAATILLVATLVDDVGLTADLPRAMIRPMGVVTLLGFLPGFEAMAASAPALGALRGATAVLLVLAALGWRTRVVLPMAALAYVVSSGLVRRYFTFYHVGVVPLYVLVVLACTPCADAWSLDRRRRLAAGERLPPAGEPTAAHGWARHACFAAIALPYVAAGLSKLRNAGLEWAAPANLRHVLWSTALGPMRWDWPAASWVAAAPDALLALVGAGVVVTEIACAAVLWSRLARRLVPWLMVGFHAAVLFAQNILFLDLIALQAAFAGAGRRTSGQVDGGRPAPARLVLLAGVCAVVAASWAGRVELYPLTAMQMFSWPHGSGPVSYYRLDARSEGGRPVPGLLERCLPRSAPLRMVLSEVFDAERGPIATDLLRVCAARHDRSAPSGERLARLAVEQWRRELAAVPADGGRGRRVDRRAVPLAPNAPAPSPAAATPGAAAGAPPAARAGSPGPGTRR